MRARLEDLGDNYTVVMSVWNGMPDEVRETTGWMFSRDYDHALSQSGDHLGIGGSGTEPGRIIFQSGEGEPLVGKTRIARWSWTNVMMVREGKSVRIYLDGNPEPEIDATVRSISIADTIFVGGRSDKESGFEGRIDEVAVFDRALKPDDLSIAQSPQ